MEIDTREESSGQTIVVTGEVDLNSSPKLRKAILGAIDESPRVGINLAGASYMDSSGVATLVEGLKSASEKKKSFIILQPSNAVMKVLKLARLDALFDIRDSMDKG